MGAEICVSLFSSSASRAITSNRWRRLNCYQTTADSPPSMLIAVPVMNAARSETRNATKSATSLASPRRPSGWFFPCCSQYSSRVPGEPCACQPRTPCAVLIEVKQTVLTRILSGSKSLERALVKAIPAARLTEVGHEPAPGCLPPGWVMLMMRPPSADLI